MVRVALITTDKSVSSMCEAEAIKHAIDFVYNDSVPASMLDKAVLNAMENEVDLIIAYCRMPIRNVYKGATIPVIYIGYTQTELREIASVMAENCGCQPQETVFIIPEILLSRIRDSGGMVVSDLNIIHVEDSGGIAGAVEKAAGGRFALILGDDEVCEYAAKVGLKSTAVKPGWESIRGALALAALYSERIRVTKQYNLELSVVMNSTSCGIIKVNPRGIITAMNNIAVHMLDCKGKIVIGRYILNIFQGLEKETLETALVSGALVYNQIVRTKTKGYTINIEPVIEDNEILSAIIMIQKTTSSLVNAAEADMTSDASGRYPQISSFVHISETFKNVLKKAKFAACTDAPVLLTGEEGTETLEMAQFMYNESGRSNKPFIELECNAWSQQRVSELLFGNDGKAYGSENDKFIVEIAEGGTIFLNHIDELSKELQFRVYKLMTGYYTLHSEMRRKPANVRIIAATSKNLQELMARGEFREDLYYALSVITIAIPSLRERKEDISYIVDYWVSHYGDAYSKHVHLSKNTYDCISEFSWPGNTRQLKHYCQKLVINTPHRSIGEAFARNELVSINNAAEANGAVELVNMNNEAAVIRDTLEHNKGNRTKTAEELRISKTTLWRKIQKYGITTSYK